MTTISILLDLLSCALVGWAVWKHRQYRESDADAKVRRAQEVARVAVKAAGSDVQKAVAVFRLFDFAEDGKYDWNEKQIGEFLSAARKEIGEK